MTERLTEAQARVLGWIEQVEGKVAGAGFAAMVQWAHAAGLARMEPLGKWTVRPSLADRGRAALDGWRGGRGS